jgi:8-oxo-dGTP pyrophosphatase MutT (NUDIX family)
MYLFLKQYLKDRLQGELPGYQSHSKMLPPGRRLKAAPEEIALVKESGVLILLFPIDGRLYTCLTQRPLTLTHHPGQISFPGGKVEDGDTSAEMAALREANEEIGVEIADLEVLGSLSNLYVEVSKFSIHPFLAWMQGQPRFTVNADEVEEVILFPIGDFVENEVINETQIKTSIGILDIKYYPLDGKIIWGATAMILSELIDILKVFRRAEKNNQLFVNQS